MYSGFFQLTPSSVQLSSHCSSAHLRSSESSSAMHMHSEGMSFTALVLKKVISRPHSLLADLLIRRSSFCSSYRVPSVSSENRTEV